MEPEANKRRNTDLERDFHRIQQVNETMKTASANYGKLGVGIEAPWSFEMYTRGDLHEEFIRHRLKLTLDWVDALPLRPGATVLDAGCGAGLLVATLARSGLRVTAIDSSRLMTELTQQLVDIAGLSEEVTVSLDDVQNLNMPDECFDLVTALGVLGWLPSPAQAVAEMSRVLRPGGNLIFSCGHSRAAKHFIEPLTNPLLKPIRPALHASIGRLRPTLDFRSFAADGAGRLPCGWRTCV